MPASTIEPRTLTADEQRKLVHWLYQQRIAQDALLCATGLTHDQLHHLGSIMHARLQVHAILNLNEAVWSTTHTQEVLFIALEHMLGAENLRRRVPPQRPISVADSMFGVPAPTVPDEEDRHVIAAVLRRLQETDEKLRTTDLSKRQRRLLDQMQRDRSLLDFLVDEAPAATVAEPAEAPTMTKRELEDFALWAYNQGFHRGVKAMYPKATDDQINTPYWSHFFAAQLIADWRTNRQAEETQS